MTEAAEEIRAAADPEANIIFGTSFDERLGDEVIITVIATGFDANRRRDARPQRAPTASPFEVARGPARPERDYLGELESSRRAAADADARPIPEIQPADARRGEPPARAERTVGPGAGPGHERPRRTLRRGRPRDPELPAPQQVGGPVDAGPVRAPRSGARSPGSPPRAPPSSRGSRPPARARAATPAAVTLVAVSKTVPGRAPPGRRRRRASRCSARTGSRRRPRRSPLVPGARWHLVGPLQANKARRAIELFDVLEAVDSVELARRLDRIAARGPARAARCRSCWRSTSTPTRPRPASRRTTVAAAAARARWPCRTSRCAGS